MLGHIVVTLLMILLPCVIAEINSYPEMLNNIFDQNTMLAMLEI